MLLRRVKYQDTLFLWLAPLVKTAYEIPTPYEHEKRVDAKLGQ